MKKLALLFCAVWMVVSAPLAFAHDHKMALQVSSSDSLSHKLALNNARNLKTSLGNDEIDVEVVVYGPGMKLLLADGANAERVAMLQKEHGIRFSICAGTLKAYAKRNGGEEPSLVGGVTRVSTGAMRLLELQEKGYAYMRP